MKKLVGLALAASLLLPGVATARGYRNGTVSTPFGSINTNSAAYQMSGGDPFAAMQMQQQMMLMQQQQQMLKMEQQFQQRMQKDPKFRKQVEDAQAQAKAQAEAAYAAQQPKKKKKRPTFNGSAATKDAIKARTDDKKVTDEKPAATSPGSDLKNRRDDPTDASSAKAEPKPAK